MLMLERTTTHLTRDERGFTLIETLVAILTGVVVTGALFAILEISLHQTSRLTDVTQATQMGRTSMTHIVDELHSACLAQGFTPVQENSTENELIFVNAYSKEPSITTAKSNAKEGAYKHAIKWESTTGTLADSTYESTGYETANSSSPSELTFSATAKPTTGTRIGEDISQSEVEKGGKKSKVPIFQYYKYAGASASTSSSGLSTLEPITLSGTEKLTKATAKEVASVLISFKAAPTDGNTALGRADNFSSQVTLAFSAPNAEATVEDSPCQ